MDQLTNIADNINYSMMKVCMECGVEFDFRATAIIAAYSADVRSRQICGSCRENALLIFEERMALNAANTRRMTLQRQARRWVEDSERGVPMHFRDATLDNFDASDGNNLRRVEMLQDWLDEFPATIAPVGVKSLLLTRSEHGVGKTHLACAILHHVMERCELEMEGAPFQFWTMDRIRNKIHAARFHRSDDVEEYICHELINAWLLVIDDVHPNYYDTREFHPAYSAEQDHSIYYQIINGRYNNNLPVIITSNVGLWDETDPSLKSRNTLVEAMGTASADRIKQMTGGVQIVVDGESRR